MPELRLRPMREEEIADLLPRGGKGYNRQLVVETADGRSVGYVVYALRAQGRKAWLYELEIDEPERGRGYGREALRLFEEHARARGVLEVGLNVFAGNELARALYRRSGWREQSVWMIKSLA